MIHLKYNNSTLVTLNLNERNPFENPVYIFKFTHKQSKSVTIFTAEDISEYPKMYNRFLITVQENNPDLNLGVLNIEAGEYSYKIFVSNSQVIPMDEELGNIDDENCDLKLIQNGIAIVHQVKEEKVIAPSKNNEKIIYTRKKPGQ